MGIGDESQRRVLLAAPARGFVTASGAPNRAMMKQVIGIATLSERSTMSLFASFPDRLSASMYRPSSL